jgi:hypothetical protein
MKNNESKELLYHNLLIEFCKVSTPENAEKAFLGALNTLNENLRKYKQKVIMENDKKSGGVH